MVSDGTICLACLLEQMMGGTRAVAPMAGAEDEDGAEEDDGPSPLLAAAEEDALRYLRSLLKEGSGTLGDSGLWAAQTILLHVREGIGC